jgi:hypothetical protein
MQQRVFLYIKGTYDNEASTSLKEKNQFKLYGVPESRVGRCFWMQEAMGKPYELVSKTANPSGQLNLHIHGEVLIYCVLGRLFYLQEIGVK